jgi:CDP-4-dehydro-6-deoxyglucose reductase
MFTIRLKNDKKFNCNKNTTIFEAAKASGILLEHSCLNARCRSCVIKIKEGSTRDKTEDLVLTEQEKLGNLTLSCNAFPTSDLILDVEDLGGIELYEKKIVPAKIEGIETLTPDIIKLLLRLSPTANFKYNSGQYVNLIKGTVKRSYSIANVFQENASLEFLIKKYETGLMSKYWFEEAKENDLLRMEGPLGTFFYRETKKQNIVFLATGTGIAPIKSIIENFIQNEDNFKTKTIWIFYGGRNENEFYWVPPNSKLNFNVVPVLSRPSNNCDYEMGYIQNIVLKQNIDLRNSVVYACGLNKMIEDSFELLTKNGLDEKDFYSDAFVVSN